MSRPMWQAQRKHEAEDNKTKQETGDKISETKIRYTEMHIEYDTAEKLSYIASEVFLWILDSKVYQSIYYSACFYMCTLVKPQLSKLDFVSYKRIHLIRVYSLSWHSLVSHSQNPTLILWY